jgi:hypothetical protein
MSDSDPYRIELSVDVRYDWDASPPTATGVVLVNDHVVWSTKPANLPDSNEKAQEVVLNGLLQQARDRLAAKLKLLLN